MRSLNEGEANDPLTDDEVDVFLEQLGVRFDLKRYPGRPWNPHYERWRARFQYRDKAGDSLTLAIYRWVRVLPRQDMGITAYEILSGRVREKPEDFDQFCSTYGYTPKSLQARAEYEAERREVEEIQRFFDRAATEHPEMAVMETLARI